MTTTTKIVSTETPTEANGVRGSELRSGDWFDQLGKLIAKATNASFDCGEFKITTANGDEYNKLLEKSSNARVELMTYIRAALSNTP